MENICRYKQRAGFISTFYAAPMALRIRKLREQRGWTQDDLASRANVSRSQLAQIESETRPVNTLRLTAIAKALNVDVASLFDLPLLDQRLMDIARGLSEKDRETIVRLAEALAGQSPTSDKPSQ